MDLRGIKEVESIEFTTGFALGGIKKKVQKIISSFQGC